MAADQEGEPPAETNSDAGAVPQRPLRRDAIRNRQKILRSAAVVLAERGLEATLDDVAAHAGVGVGTMYRHFPGKQALTRALFEEALDALVALAEAALAEPDPWEGLVGYLQQAATLLAADRGLRQVVMFATFGDDQAAQMRARMQPLTTRLLQRAQQAGVVRADLSASDIPLAVFMLAAAADYTRPVRPAAWQRYLALYLDSLPPARAGTTALPEPALSPAEMEQALRSGRPPHC